METKRRFISILFVVFLFCAIFTPDFFSFSMRYLVIIVCTIGIIIRWIRHRRIDLDKRFLSIFIGFIPFLIWFTLAQIIHIITDKANKSVYIYTLEHILEVFLAAFIIGLFLIYITSRFEFDNTFFMKCLLWVSLIQFVCVVLALIFPPIRIFFNSFIIRNSYSEKLAQFALASNSGLVDRSYGLSNNLFDSFGYITAILICVVYILGMDSKNNRIRILSYFMIIMPLVNARTGLVLVLVGILISSLFYQSVKTVLKSVLLVAVVAVAFYFIILNLPESMVKWLSQGMQETLSLFSGSETSGVYAKLLQKDMVFPSSILLGDGATPKMLNYRSVDNGYVTCLWNFGLIGSFFLLIGYLNMFRLSYVSCKCKMNRALSLVLAICFFLYLFKVYSIDNFGGIVLAFGIVTLLLVNGNKSSNIAVLPEISDVKHIKGEKTFVNTPLTSSASNLDQYFDKYIKTDCEDDNE